MFTVCGVPLEFSLQINKHSFNLTLAVLLRGRNRLCPLFKEADKTVVIEKSGAPKWFHLIAKSRTAKEPTTYLFKLLAWEICVSVKFGHPIANKLFFVELACLVAGTRWVQSTFSTHFPLSANRRL